MIRLAILAALVLGSAATFAQAPEAFACSCTQPRPPSETFEQSTAVFAGKVTSIKSGDYSKTVQFDVEMAWKGISETPVTLTTAGSGASCGYEFEEGVGYLVYAYGKESLETGMCGRTQPFVDAYQDLAYLGAGYVPEPGQPVVEKRPDNQLLPFLGIGAAVAGAIALIALRNRR